MKQVLTRRRALAALGGMPMLSMAQAFGGEEQGPAFRALDKAMWVWKLDWTFAKELRAFAADQGITALYVSLSSGVRERMLAGDRGLIDSVRMLADDGAAIWLLTGDPAWIEQPTRIPVALEDLMKLHERLQLFSGLHFDVEPHAHPRWRSDPASRPMLLEAFVALLAVVNSRAPGLPIEAAISPVITQYRLRNGENALLAITRYLTSVSIMAYRRTAAATVNWAAPTIHELKSTKVTWRMGALVHQSNEGDIGFFQVPLPEFQAEMLELDRLLRAQSDGQSYRGLVFEDYHGLRQLIGTKKQKDNNQ